MTSSLTVVFSGTTTVLQSSFLPEITWDEEYDYSCALLDLIVKNSKESKEIVKLGEIRIDCDIVSGSYINGVQTHTIHQFIASASHVQDKTFVEIPKHLNYFPVKVKSLRSIQISIVDKKGAPVEIGVPEPTPSDIICRIIIKRDRK